jgi:RHS repeat-associated protein
MDRGGETDAGPAKSSSASASALTLPKGGGAIRGMDEKFTSNPATGTGSMRVPIVMSRGRSESFAPEVTLSYDSGNGNGTFGFGWSLSLPAITRKTDKGLPRYDDGGESDVFLISGAEDLVPILKSDGTRFVDDTSAEGFTIHRYRPRIDSLFARIERWTERATGEIHWRSITRDNITTLYGRTNGSRIFDPDDDPAHPSRIFTWLISESFDDRGNAILYEYFAEDGALVDTAAANERNRVRTANRHLKRIKYGNRTSHLIQPDLAQTEWMFELVLDYDEAHLEELPLDGALPAAEQHRLVRAAIAPGKKWSVRPDPFSSHRAGFETRTYRRCRRLLTFHRFPELGPEPCLVRSVELDYRDLSYDQPVSAETELTHPGSTRFGSFLGAITQRGYVRDAAQPVLVQNGARYVTYLAKSLPPIEFAYSKAEIQEETRELDRQSAANLPAGAGGDAYQWMDLDGEGLSGILAEQAGALFYKPNLGNGKLGPVEVVATQPSLVHLAGHPRFLDIDGDGALDLVDLGGAAASGFYERTFDRDWEGFRAFATLPNIDWNDSRLRFVDLDGDGLADVLITADDALTWHASLGEEGFGEAHRVPTSRDEERGPRLVVAERTEAIYLADMCGDGLSDLVRIRNGEVCYWPNLGYGRFGAKVTMDDAPWFDHGDQFDQRRIRLTDIDGSGTTDVVYLGRDGVRIYFNQSGNRWSAPRRLQFPATDDLTSVTTADLLGNGTSCLVWSSPLPAAASASLRFVDLTGGKKPHLLVRSINNLGAETTIDYAPSTKFYLADKRAGRPWVTRIPFPVHVVERVTIDDRISRNRFVTRYAYHHGYFDGVEREFRGFGMVEQWDTEELMAIGGGADAGEAIDKTSDTPPVLTKSWFHTGVYLGRDHVSDVFAGLLDPNDPGEYYREPAWRNDDVEAAKRLLPDAVLPAGLTEHEEREACRALRGSLLRQETYTLDDTATAQDPTGHPYVVLEQNFSVELLQSRRGNPHAVFFTHAREAIKHHYERDPKDPRVSHTLTLQTDEFGNVIRAAEVAYARAAGPERLPDQNATHVVVTLSRVANRDDQFDWRRIGVPVETRKYELCKPPAPSLRFTWDALRDLVENLVPAGAFEPPQAKTLPAEAWDWRAQWNPQLEPGGVLHSRLRLLEHTRARYRPDDLGAAQNQPLALLPLGSVESRAIEGEAYQLVFTPSLAAAVYGARVSDAILIDAGYVHSEGDANWWMPSGRDFYSPGAGDTAPQERDFGRAHFFRKHRHRDPFHTALASTETFTKYDAYDLLVVDERDPLGNRSTAGARDANGDIDIAGNDYRVLQPTLVTDANGNRGAVLFDAVGMVVATAVMGKRTPAPAEGDTLTGAAADLTDAVLLDHLAQPRANPHAILGRATTRIVYDYFAYHRTRNDAIPQPGTVYTIVREIHDADPGGAQTPVQHNFTYSDGFGREIQKKTDAETGQWIGTGWTVFNNKGKPVRQYEPFFTPTHRFEFDLRVGVSRMLFYDPMDRVVATLHPNHSYAKTVVHAWKQEEWDPSDTVLLDPAVDPDVRCFFMHIDGTPRVAAAEYLPTWHALRTNPAHAAEALARWPDGTTRADETAAAEKTAIHAGTPGIGHVDPLGRAILTTVRNRSQYSNAAAPVEELLETRARFDVEGNQRVLSDPFGRIVERCDYDVLRERIHEANIDAGEQWMLADAARKPLFIWNSRDNRIRTGYDVLRRPAAQFLSANNAAEVCVTRTTYGEVRPNPEAANLRKAVAEVADQAGVATSEQYDFKKNLLRSRRQLATAYKATLDWLNAVSLQQDSFVSSTTYDALNRPSQLRTPDASVARITYNAANLLERLDVNLRGAQQNAQPVWTPFVLNVDYNARGQRVRVEFGNGVVTTYTYDDFTFLLAHFVTRRDPALFPDDCPQPSLPDWPGCRVQSLHYTYDPSSNVTSARDDAQQKVFFQNKRVDPRADYTYDALYRLIEATGREHLGQGGAPIPASYNDAPHTGVSFAASDGNAMGRYLERYVYDVAGNIRELVHRGTDPANPGWKRTYEYIEPIPANRLSRTTVDGNDEIYSNGGDGYDAHGNLLRMPHLQVMRWDFGERLQMTQRQAVNVNDADGVAHHGERTWYVYDAKGERVRKVTELGSGAIKEERIYLGGFEVFRTSGVNARVRETLHVMDAKRRVALVETRTAGNEPGIPGQLVRYQFDNRIDSVTFELDAQAQLVSYEEYSPYGSTTYQLHTATAAPKRYRHTGKERDEESGLQYHGARYYAPWLARWTSPDPEGTKESLNLYVAMGNRPTSFVDPDGRKPTEVDKGSGATTTGTAPTTPSAKDPMAAPLPPATSSSGGKPGFFEWLAHGLQSIAQWTRNWLPGLIAAPIGGLIDILAGLTQVIGGIAHWEGSEVTRGLATMGLGLLSMIGLKEVISEKWTGRIRTSGIHLPPTLAADITHAEEFVPDDAAENGMHSWHAATNAVVTSRLGPVAAPFLWIAGLIHESPIDWPSFQAEQTNQGTVNHILDSLMDIVSNTFGIILGLLLPRRLAGPAAGFLGNYIPGPSDSDPAIGGTGGYKGNPADAWGPYFQKKKTP